MTLLSFRVPDADASMVEAWAERLGLDRSEILRDALRRHLLRLASEYEPDVWERIPLDEGELSFGAIAEWGPAEDWSDWANAEG